MSILRFLAYFLSAFSLSVLIACGSQPGPIATTPSTAPSMSAEANHSMHGKKININTAILSQLDKLEAALGVPALSNKIQASRPYGKVEELVSKNVITQPQFDQIKDMVTIEEIQLTGEAKDIDYITKLGLMKGHLMVAKELLELQKPDQAEPHIGHPVEEIYSDVEDQLNERKVPAFKEQLITLQDQVKAGAKDTAKVDAGLKSSMQAIEKAIAALPETQRNSPSFVLQVISGLLDTANSEYAAAIADQKISQVIEYQDSRGFVMYANDLYKGIASQVSKASPDAHQALTKDLADLSTAWASPLPPATLVKTSDQVSQLVKSIETTARKMAKAA